MIVIGLAVLINQDEFRKLSQEFLASRALLFLSGFVMLPAGIAILLVHNIWLLNCASRISARSSSWSAKS